jgi:aryl-alcohol dehydrogenase-like predicted oxidoreductase
MSAPQGSAKKTTAIDRRRFLESSAGAAAALATLGGATGGAANAADAQASGAASDVPPPPVVPLGKTGLEVTRLAQGTGVHGGNRQSDQTREGFGELTGLFQHAYDRGIRLFDLADLYGTHLYFREALRTFPRDKVKILTKIWWRYDGPEDAAGTRQPARADACRATLERFRHELNTDHLDIVLLHCCMSPTWDTDLEVYRDVLSAAKEKQEVGVVGVSCHTLDALKTAAKCPWVDVILSRINPKGASMDGSADVVMPVLREARKNGKAIIGMKIFGEGKLSGEREACMQFAQENGLLDAMTIGFHTPAQIDDALRLMHRWPAKPPV